MTLACTYLLVYLKRVPTDEEVMAKRQTRRSISVKGLTYQRLKNFCETKGLSVSGYLEDIISQRLDAANVPVPERVEMPVKPKSLHTEEIISQHFTF
jgi:hypothetical protein